MHESDSATCNQLCGFGNMSKSRRPSAVFIHEKQLLFLILSWMYSCQKNREMNVGSNQRTIKAKREQRSYCIAARYYFSSTTVVRRESSNLEEKGKLALSQFRYLSFSLYSRTKIVQLLCSYVAYTPFDSFELSSLMGNTTVCRFCVCLQFVVEEERLT